MSEEELSKQMLKDWIRRRASAVRAKFSAFDALVEIGVQDVPDETTPTQIACPYHGADNRPSARYYPRSGVKYDYVHCYKCKESWDSINLIAKSRGKKFMDALQELERRFRIHIEKRPEAPVYEDPVDRGSNYESDKWADIPRVLAHVDKKLRRVRDYCGLTDYTKFCRVLDAVAYDFDKTGKPTPEMIAVLRKLMVRIEDAKVLWDVQDNLDDQPDA